MADADRVGQQLGNYRLERLLGAGGFAEVYLAEHIFLQTPAAIKVLHTRLAQEDLDDFLSEGRTIARLKHPNIVRVLEFGVEGRTPYLVMDYAPNGTLRQKHPKGSRIAPGAIVPYLKQMAEALQYAHDQKLIHRDVKPENMLIGERNEVLLSDFGIALVAQSSRSQGTQEAIGTVAYMAPEQIQGHPRPASDQYSLAIAAYEWLGGARPFSGSFTELCSQHLFAAPPPLREKVPGLSPQIEQVVLTALAKDPRERFASVRAFATAFENASHAPTTWPAPQPPAPNATADPQHNQPTPPSLYDAPTRLTPPVPGGLPADRLTQPARPPSGVTPPLAMTPPFSGQINTPPPGPAAHDTWFSPTPPGRSLRQGGAVVAPGEGAARPHWWQSRRKVLVRALVLVLVLAVIGVSFVVTRPHGGSGFQQDTMTGADIIDIQVGTGYDTTTQMITGETDTFHVNNRVYVAFTVASDATSAEARLTLKDDADGTVYEMSYQVGLDSEFGYYQSNIVDSAALTATGVYKWEVDYNGAPEASITFQVIP